METDSGLGLAMILLGVCLVALLFIYICMRRNCKRGSMKYEELQLDDELDDEEIRFKKLIESNGSDFNPFAELNNDADISTEKYSFLSGSKGFENDDIEDDDGDNIFELDSKDKNRLDQLEQFRSNLVLASSNMDMSVSDVGEDQKDIENMRL